MNTVIKKNTREPDSLLSKYNSKISSRLVMVTESGKGINASALKDLIRLSQYKKAFIAGLLNISVKTLDRYMQTNKKLHPLNSEIILKLFSLYAKGIETFGSLEFFKNWLEKPAYGLNNEVPVTFFNLSSGIDLVYEELVRIEFGDLG